MNGMTRQRVLFMPGRFVDYRLWSDIPDRIRPQAEPIHFDQHYEIHWTGADHEFVDSARSLANGAPFDVVASAREADRLAFSLAEAGLTRGLVLFQPDLPLSAIPGVRPDLSDVDFEQMRETVDNGYPPLEGAIHQSDPAVRRNALVSFVRNYAGVHLEPHELELAISMASDHADEIFGSVDTFLAANAEGRVPEKRWTDRDWLAQFTAATVPIALIVPKRARPFADAIATDHDVEIVTYGGTAGLASEDDRARGAETILRVLNRVRHG